MNKKAFSLLELLIVIAIISIMLAIGIVSLMSGKSSAKLDGAGREFSSIVKLAQSYALQGKTVSEGGLNIIPCGYGVYTDKNDSTKYEIFYLNDSDCDVFNRAPLSFANVKFLESHNLKEGVFFRIDSRDKFIYFTVPHGVIFGNDGNILSAIATTTLELNDREKSIAVGIGGTITENPVVE